MQIRKSDLLFASVVVTALLGFVTYLSNLGEPESNDLVAPVIPKRRKRGLKHRFKILESL